MTVELYCGDAIEVMRDLPDNSIDLIATDPPYYRVKNSEAWDRQWDKPDQFLAWLDTALEQMERILKPNGSLYLFASPKMAARVEVLIGQRFNVLNHIVWKKEGSTRANQASKKALRMFFADSERIIFAEHYGADNIAKGEAGYAAKCDELRGFIFEPIRAYLDGERKRAGVTIRQVNEAFQRKRGSRTVSSMAGHWFNRVQWILPTEENYQWLRQTLSSLNHNGDYLQRPYEYLRREYEELRQEYEELRREYEDLRRPFSVTADVPYTDVWTFPTVPAYPGKHPCEKPLGMLRHIIEVSSKPGATVLDCFMGSGTTGVAAQELGRNFIGVELDTKYFAQAQRRITEAQAQLPLLDWTGCQFGSV